MSDVRVMWPFAPNWASPWRVTYAFRTDVFTNRAGGEQRRALRVNPRKRIMFSALYDAHQLRTFNRIMATAQNLPIVMPEVTRKARLAAATASGATSATISGSVPAWLSAGAEVVLVQGNSRKVAAVNSVASGTVTFEAAIGAWPAGTLIHPALTGLLDGELRTSRVTNGVATGQVAFEVEPGSETYVPPAAPLTLGPTEIFDLKPNWSRAIEVNHLWPVEQVDYGFGRRVTHRPVDFPTRTASAAYLRRNAAEAEALLNAFLRAKGQRGVLLVSTRENDLPVAANLGSAGTSFRVAGGDTFDAYAEDPVHRAVALHLADGRTLYRNVTSMSENAGDTVVNVGIAWGENIATSQILACSWLLQNRFGSDELTIEWLTDEVAQAQVPLRSLPAVAPTDYMALRATMAGDIRETVAGDTRAVIYLPVNS